MAKVNMAKLLEKAKAIKTDPNVKHTLSQSQIKEIKENTTLLTPYQYETIKGENRNERP